ALRNRSRAASFSVTASGKNFKATCCPSLRSSARYTSPIPPLPNRATIRYRSANTVPGKKRLSSRELDERVSERGLSEEREDDRPVDGIVSVSVPGVSLPIGFPHDEQKRLLSETSVLLNVHFIMRRGSQSLQSEPDAVNFIVSYPYS